MTDDMGFSDELTQLAEQTAKGKPKFEARLIITKPGSNLDKLQQDPILAQMPVIGGMYVYKYITAQLGGKIKITIEADDGE